MTGRVRLLILSTVEFLKRGAAPMNDTDSSAYDDDELITFSRVLELMGDMPLSTAYEDPELMALKINMTVPGRRSHAVRFIKRKVLDLRAKRIRASEANAVKVRAEVERRIEHRRTRQREEKRQAYAKLKAEPAPAVVVKPKKLKLKPRTKKTKTKTTKTKIAAEIGA